MSAEEHTGLVRRYLEAGDVDAFDEIFAADFVGHRPDGGENRGPEGMKAFIASVRARIHGLRVEVRELFADGQLVVAWITVGGTLAATGAPISFPEMQLYRIADGKIAERWYAVDRAGLPRPAAPPPETR